MYASYTKTIFSEHLYSLKYGSVNLRNKDVDCIKSHVKLSELNSTPVLNPIRVESLLPDNDWKTTWRLLRTKGLSSQQSSFLFKLLHQLLPTQDRIGRITREPGICKVCHLETDHLLHALLLCPDSRATADKLLGFVHVVVPDLDPDRLLLLDFGTELGEADTLPVLSIVSTGLRYIWEARA